MVACRIHGNCLFVCCRDRQAVVGNLVTVRVFKLCSFKQVAVSTPNQARHGVRFMLKHLQMLRWVSKGQMLVQHIRFASHLQLPQDLPEIAGLGLLQMQDQVRL